MKIKFSSSLVLGFAAINFILVGFLFYWFIFRGNSIEATKERCNISVLENNLIGRTLPKYEFTNLNGADMYQELTNGKVLIVVFLTDCQACLKEFDLFDKHYQEISSQIKIVAITGESKGIAKRFIETRQPMFPVYLDTNGSLMLQMRVSCTPTMFFLENGVVRKVKVGMTEDYKEIMEGFLL